VPGQAQKDGCQSVGVDSLDAGNRIDRALAKQEIVAALGEREAGKGVAGVEGEGQLKRSLGAGLAPTRQGREGVGLEINRIERTRQKTLFIGTCPGIVIRNGKVIGIKLDDGRLRQVCNRQQAKGQKRFGK